MKSAAPRVLTINGGSSSIKFALFEAGGALRRDPPRASLSELDCRRPPCGSRGTNSAGNFSRPVTAADHTAAVDALMEWIEEHSGRDALAAVGHRVVHGGPNYSQPQQVTAEMVEELHRLSPFDPEHLPLEIELIEAFRQRHPNRLRWRASTLRFTARMPRVATLLPIPRRYEARASAVTAFTACLMNSSWPELARLGDPAATKGRAILAQLGTVRACAAGARRQEHRHQHGLHADGGTR